MLPTATLISKERNLHIDCGIDTSTNTAGIWIACFPIWRSVFHNYSETGTRFQRASVSYGNSYLCWINLSCLYAFILQWDVALTSHSHLQCFLKVNKILNICSTVGNVGHSRRMQVTNLPLHTFGDDADQVRCLITYGLCWFVNRLSRPVQQMEKWCRVSLIWPWHLQRCYESTSTSVV